MNQQEMKIIPPEGYEVDKENSTFECIKFKPIELQLPKTWEEFCETHPLKEGESWLNSLSEIYSVEVGGGLRRVDRDKQVLPSEKYAEAMLALCQLIQLRDCYNDGWEPNWDEEYYDKWCIEVFRGNIDTAVHTVDTRMLTFSSRKIRDKFLENFKDLIEIAKPLL